MTITQEGWKQMQRRHETLRKLVVVIAIALSSNANAETFEQWVKNAGVHADRQMSPDQSRQFFLDYYASQGHHFDPNAVEFNAVTAAVQVNSAVIGDRKPDDHKCDTNENGTVTVCNDLWLIKDGNMWKVTVTTPKGNRVSYCNMRYGPAATKNVAACGYYNVEADGHEKATEYSVMVNQVEVSWRARDKRPPFMEMAIVSTLNNGRNVCSVNGGQLVEPSWCSDPAQGNWHCDTSRNTKPFVD